MSPGELSVGRACLPVHEVALSTLSLSPHLGLGSLNPSSKGPAKKAYGSDVRAGWRGRDFPGARLGKPRLGEKAAAWLPRILVS